MTQQVTLELTIPQLNTILVGVAKLPIETGLEVFNLIQQQANNQLATKPSGPLADKVI